MFFFLVVLVCLFYSVIFVFFLFFVLKSISIHFSIVLGRLPRAWSTPALGPYVRSGLKPPLLQQAAFDDLVFRVDVMRNVGSKNLQEGDDQQKDEIKTPEKWNSLPALNLLDKEGGATKEKAAEEEDGAQNGDEGLQEVGY